MTAQKDPTPPRIDQWVDENGVTHAVCIVDPGQPIPLGFVDTGIRIPSAPDSFSPESICDVEALFATDRKRKEPYVTSPLQQIEKRLRRRIRQYLRKKGQIHLAPKFIETLMRPLLGDVTQIAGFPMSGVWWLDADEQAAYIAKQASPVRISLVARVCSDSLLDWYYEHHLNKIHLPIDCEDDCSL